MALGMVSGRFQFQRGTKAQWEESDIVLLDGEIAIESDTTKMKAGDGKTLYKDLPYISIGDFSFADLSEEDKKRVQGKKGDPFTYEDFTQKQLDALKGKKGDPFRFEDFTKEQLASLVGPKGDAFKFEDFTDEQLEKLGVSITDISKKGSENIITFKGGKQLVVKDGENGKDGSVDVETLSELDDEQKKNIRDAIKVPDEDAISNMLSVRNMVRNVVLSNTVFFIPESNAAKGLNKFFGGSFSPDLLNISNNKDLFEQQSVVEHMVENPKIMRAIVDSPNALDYFESSSIAKKVLIENLGNKKWDNELLGDFDYIEVEAGSIKTFKHYGIISIETIETIKNNKIHCKLVSRNDEKNARIIKWDDGLIYLDEKAPYLATMSFTIYNNFEDSNDIRVHFSTYE